jgi:hypothetical protein
MIIRFCLVANLYDFPADKDFGVFIDKGRQFLWGLPSCLEMFHPE